jgi:hypothetical protein
VGSIDNVRKNCLISLAFVEWKFLYILGFAQSADLMVKTPFDKGS